MGVQTLWTDFICDETGEDLLGGGLHAGPQLGLGATSRCGKIGRSVHRGSVLRRLILTPRGIVLRRLTLMPRGNVLRGTVLWLEMRLSVKPWRVQGKPADSTCPEVECRTLAPGSRQYLMRRRCFPQKG